MNATPEITTTSVGSASVAQGDVTRSDSHVAGRDIEAVERALIDQSARGPVLTFFTMAIFWLLVSVVLGYIASKQLHAPGLSLAPSGFTDCYTSRARRIPSSSISRTAACGRRTRRR